MEADPIVILSRSVTLFIVAGGPSVKGLDLHILKDFGTVIGVNDSAFHVPCNIAFTMDGLWLKNRWEQVKGMGIDLVARQTAFRKHVGMEHQWDRCHLYEFLPDKERFSETPDALTGANSGSVALNYAYLCRPKQVFLFGYDLTTDPAKGFACDHWYGDYPWGKRKTTQGYTGWIDAHVNYKRQFDAQGIAVYNVSPISRIHSYPKVSFNEMIRALR